MDEYEEVKGEDQFGQSQLLMEMHQLRKDFKVLELVLNKLSKLNLDLKEQLLFLRKENFVDVVIIGLLVGLLFMSLYKV